MKGQTLERELRKLARYRSNDIVKLAFLEPEEAHRIDSLDLTGLAELKRGSNGVMELKLIDRLRVLELLDKIGQRKNGEELSALLSSLGKGEEQ